MTLRILTLTEPQKVNIKAKFHYASWFEAGSKLVADRLRTRQRNGIWLYAGVLSLFAVIKTATELKLECIAIWL